MLNHHPTFFLIHARPRFGHLHQISPLALAESRSQPRAWVVAFPYVLDNTLSRFPYEPSLSDPRPRTVH